MGHCDQCEALIINGVFCHEQGCPNQNKQWHEEDEVWLSVITCDICGYEHFEDEICSCYSDEYLEED